MFLGTYHTGLVNTSNPKTTLLSVWMQMGRLCAHCLEKRMNVGLHNPHIQGAWIEEEAKEKQGSQVLVGFQRNVKIPLACK